MMDEYEFTIITYGEDTGLTADKLLTLLRSHIGDNVEVSVSDMDSEIHSPARRPNPKDGSNE